jgi:hypothetical protein
MARFYGGVGYAETKETSSGVYTDNIIERNHSGEVIRDSRHWQSGENQNDDLRLSNKISILADAFAYQNFQNIKYVNWMGTSWKVVEIDVQRPRLMLTLGGVYNGPKVTTPSTP